jgi:hypothetical protein
MYTTKMLFQIKVTELEDSMYNCMYQKAFDIAVMFCFGGNAKYSMTKITVWR